MKQHKLFSLLEDISFDAKDDFLQGLSYLSDKELDTIYAGLTTSNISSNQLIDYLFKQLQIRTKHIQRLLQDIRLKSIYIEEMLEYEDPDALLHNI